MAFDPNNLSALTYANGFTLWSYKTPDLTTEIEGPSYFDEARAMLRCGDFMFVDKLDRHDNHSASAQLVVVDNRSEMIKADVGYKQLDHPVVVKRTGEWVGLGDRYVERVDPLFDKNGDVRGLEIA